MISGDDICKANFQVYGRCWKLFLQLFRVLWVSSRLFGISWPNEPYSCTVIAVLFLPSLRLLFVMCLCFPVSISALENSCEYIFSAVNKISPPKFIVPSAPSPFQTVDASATEASYKYCNAWWGFRVSLATVQSKELVCYKSKATTRLVYTRNSLQTEHLTSYNTI